MPPSLDRFDAFLDDPAQRDVSRALLACLFSSRHHGVVVYGAAEPAAAVVEALAEERAGHGLNVVLLTGEPPALRVPPGPARLHAADEPRATTEQLLRAVLRQDPDAIAVTHLREAAVPLAIQAALTGHQLLVGSAAPALDDFLRVWTAELPQAVQALGFAVEVAAVDGRPLLRRVARSVDGAWRDVARVDSGRAWLDRTALPAADEEGPVATPRLAPPLSARPTATRLPRPAFVPRVGAPGASSSWLAPATVTLRDGEAWPRCRACGESLSAILELDLSALPVEASPAPGLAQLFLCTRGGCELKDEGAAGVLARVLPPQGTTRCAAPPALPLVRTVSGPTCITGWERVVEEPHTEDWERLGLARSEDSWSEDASAGPLFADKLGGWPAWAQGAEWPLEEDGTPATLLFQLVEGPPLSGGRAPGWDFTRAEVLPGEPPVHVRDEHQPRHFVSVLTGEAVLLLFRRASGALAFRWQT